MTDSLIPAPSALKSSFRLVQTKPPSRVDLYCTRLSAFHVAPENCPLIIQETRTVNATLNASRDFHCITVGVREADMTLFANKILLELADKLDTPCRIVE
jgi:hypothetical protein